MVPIGASKATADLVEGTTLNVESGVVFAKAGMDIEVGDTLQPLLDYVDIAWRILITSLIYLISVKFILLGATTVARPFLVVCFAAYLLSTLMHRRVAPSNRLFGALKRIRAMCLRFWNLSFVIFLS